jgi:hypothetical protein
MNTRTARLDDPELGGEFANLQNRDKIADSRQDSVDIGPWRCFKNHNPLRALWGKAQHMTEIVIQRDQRTTFRSARREEILVRGANELLSSYCLDIVSGQAQQVSPAVADVFVELESHAT